MIATLSFSARILLGIKINSQSTCASAETALNSESNKIYQAPNESPGPISPMCSINLFYVSFSDELCRLLQHMHHPPFDPAEKLHHL